MYLKNGQIRASFADKKDYIKRYICNSCPLRLCWKSPPQLSGRSHAATLHFAGRNSRKLKHTLCHWVHRPQWHALYNPALWCCPTVLESARHTRGTKVAGVFRISWRNWAQPKRVADLKALEVDCICFGTGLSEIPNLSSIRVTNVLNWHIRSCYAAGRWMCWIMVNILWVLEWVTFLFSMA